MPVGLHRVAVECFPSKPSRLQLRRSNLGPNRCTCCDFLFACRVYHEGGVESDLSFAAPVVIFWVGGIEENIARCGQSAIAVAALLILSLAVSSALPSASRLEVDDTSAHTIRLCTMVSIYMFNLVWQRAEADPVGVCRVFTQNLSINRQPFTGSS